MREFDLVPFRPGQRRLELTVLVATVPIAAAVMILLAYNAYVNSFLAPPGPGWLAPTLIAACSVAFLVPWYLVRRLRVSRIGVGPDGIEVWRPGGERVTVTWAEPRLSMRVTHREYRARPQTSWLGFYDYALAVSKPRVVTEIPRDAYDLILATAKSHGLRAFDLQGQTRAWNWQETVFEAVAPALTAEQPRQS